MSEVSNGKVIYEGGSGEIEEKKSRFIANIAPVTTTSRMPSRKSTSNIGRPAVPEGSPSSEQRVSS